jgi:hypothetical protein
VTSVLNKLSWPCQRKNIAWLCDDTQRRFKKAVGVVKVVNGLEWFAISVSLKAVKGRRVGRFQLGCGAADKSLPGGGP